MNILKSSAAFLATLMAITAFSAAPSLAKHSTEYNSTDKVTVEKTYGKKYDYKETKKAPVKEESYDDYEDDSYDDYDYTDDSKVDKSEYEPGDVACMEGKPDKTGGHVGWHYDTDDYSSYTKTETGHCGYHYDDDDSSMDSDESDSDDSSVEQDSKKSKKHHGHHYKK